MLALPLLLDHRFIAIGARIGGIDENKCTNFSSNYIEVLIGFSHKCREGLSYILRVNIGKCI